MGIRPGIDRGNLSVPGGGSEEPERGHLKHPDRTGWKQEKNQKPGLTPTSPWSAPDVPASWDAAWHWSPRATIAASIRRRSSQLGSRLGTEKIVRQEPTRGVAE